jgi:hypothetical protein
MPRLFQSGRNEELVMKIPKDTVDSIDYKKGYRRGQEDLCGEIAHIFMKRKLI